MKKLIPSSQLVNPKLDGKFSPAFFTWFKRLEKQYGHRDPKWMFYRAKEGWRKGQVYFGFHDEGSTSVGSIHQALTRRWNGPFPCLHHCLPRQWKPEPKLWAQYLKIGRCVFDPEHVWIHADSPRFNLLSKNRRKCRWCGQLQKRVTKKVVRIQESWQPA